MKRCRSKNIDVVWCRELPFIQIDFLLKGNSANCTHWDAAARGDNAMHSTAAVYSAESPGIKTHTYLPSYTHNIFLLPPHTSTSSTWPPPPAYQSVTNIFEYSNIRIYWSRIYIRTFVRINFSFTNIFGHSFVSNLFVRIYSDIRW